MNTNIGYIFLALGIIATAGDFIVPFMLSKRFPNYSHLRDTVSTLGTAKSPVGKQASAWLIVLGFLLAGFGIGQFLLFADLTWKHWLYTGGIIAFGIGAGIVCGCFPEDPRGADESLSGKVHGIGAGIGFVFLLLNPMWALGISEFEGLEWLNAACFMAGATTFILFVVSEKRDGGILALTGLWQRLNLITVYTPLLVNYITSKPA